MPEFDWASAVDVPDGLEASAKTQYVKDQSVEEQARAVKESFLAAMQAQAQADAEKLHPEAEAAALPRGQRPTLYNSATGKFEEASPAQAAQAAIPLGPPRTTGEHAPEGGVIFSSEPWHDAGARATPQPVMLQRFASNEPGVPAGYNLEPADATAFDWSSAEDVKPQENAAPTPTQGHKTPYGQEQEQLLSGLKAEAQPYARRVLDEANQVFKDTGIEARLKEGYRTPQKQDELYAQGRTKPGEIITNARAGQSVHQSGRAMDIGLYKDGQYIDDPKDPAYKKLGPIARKFGMIWGGDFKSIYDPEHLEVPVGAPKLTTEARKAEPVASQQGPAATPEFDWGSAEDVKPGDFDWGSAADPKTQPVRTVTAYRPGGGPAQGVNSAIEGGINDAHDTPILGRTTMEDYQKGIGDYVTVAMDKNSSWQNQFLTSPNYPGVVFRVRDNGAYGNGKTGENWVDIAYTDPERAKHMLLRDVPFNVISPEAAQTISASRPDLLRTPDLLGAPDQPAPLKDIVYPKREVGFGESFSRENAREILGMGESLNRLVISPLLQGSGEAAKVVVPDSPIAKFLDKANKDWQTTMVDAASSMRKSLEIDPNTEKQGLKGEAGGMIGALFPQLLGAAVTPGTIAVKFLLPAVTEGMDAMDRARQRGAPPWQQMAQFAWGFAQSEAFVNLPLHVQSAAINPIMRFLERTTKATLVAGGAHEALRDINNIISPITGGEQQPFDWKALAKVAVPMGFFGGVMGENARPRPQGPIAEQAFPKGGEAPPPMPGGDVIVGKKVGEVVPQPENLKDRRGYVKKRKAEGATNDQAAEELKAEEDAYQAALDAALPVGSVIRNEGGLYQKDPDGIWRPIGEGDERGKGVRRGVEDEEEIVRVGDGNTHDSLDWKPAPAKTPSKVEEALSGIPPKEPAFLAKKRAKLAELEKELTTEQAKAKPEQKKINGLKGEIRFLKEAIADDEVTVKSAQERTGKPTGDERSAPGGDYRYDAEQWIKEAQKKAAETPLGKTSPDAALKVVAEWIRKGETPEGPIPDKINEALHRSLAPTRDLETGEIHDVGGEHWPSTGTLLDFLESQAQDRMVPAESEPAGVGLVASPKGVTAAGDVAEAAKAIAKEATTLKKLTDFIRALKVYVANRGKFNQRLMKVRKELDAAWKPLKLTTKQIKTRAEGITNYIQAGGDRNLLLQRAAASKNLELRKGYEAGANLTPAEVEISNKVRQIFADYLVKLRAAGVDVAEFENYVTQMWQAKLNEHAGTGVPRTLSDYFTFRKERFFKNYFEGEQAGQIPKTKDIREILATYMHTADTVINNRKLVADLLEGKSSKGHPLLLNTGGGRVVEGDKGPTLVFPGAKPGDAPEGVHYERMNFPALRKWKFVTKDSAGNPILMHGDLDVHPEIAQHLKNIFGQSWLHEYWNTPTDSPFHSLFKGVTRFAFNDAQQYFKGTMFTLSGFHQFQETVAALSQRVLPGRIGKGLDIIDLENNPKQMDAARHGLMLAPDRVASTYFNEGMMGEKNLVTLALRHIGEKYGIEAAVKAANLLKWYNDYLFHEFIPGLKYKTYDESLARNLDRFKNELADGRVTTEQVKSLTADHVNATFGHLNKDIQSIGSNKTIQHILQMLLIAPDFGEARVRHFGQAVSGLYSKKGREQFQGLLLGAGVAWAGARILNLLTDGDPHFELEHPFEVKVGNRWLGFRSTYEDIWRAFGGIHGFANRRGFGQFMANRLSPFSRTAGTYLFGYNWRGESTEQIGLGGLFKDLLFGVVPLPLQGLTNKLSPSGKSDPIGFWGHLANAFGIQVHRFSPVAEVSQAAHDWQRTYEPEKEQKGTFPLSKYIQLQYAIEDNDKNKALAEIQALKDQKMTIKDIRDGFKERIDHPFTSSNASDIKFRGSLSVNEKKKYDAAVKYKQEILRKFALWAPVK